MCGCFEQSAPDSVCNDGDLPNSQGSDHKKGDSDAETHDSTLSLLELAANNDLEGFKQCLEKDRAKLYAAGSWYSRQNGASQMKLEQRTPLMIAALYGSVEVLNYIIDLYDSSEKINFKCGRDGSTALHSAAAGGSHRAVETVKILIRAGADLNEVDAQGRRPGDVIATFPRFRHVRTELEYILKAVKQRKAVHIDVPDDIFQEDGYLLEDEAAENQMLPDDSSISAALASLKLNRKSPMSSPSPSSSPKATDTPTAKEGNSKDKEWHIDPTIPDIKSSIYMTDEFRMFSFKIRPCSRAYSHDWTECPFAHPGENARRRDPRRYHYSCVPCPDFRKGTCRRGDSCEYAHGVFECWLHPAQYRTRLCKDGTDCTRRVCFFAHTPDELRPLYISNGTTIPSPRAASLEASMMSPPLGPGSPSSAMMMNSFFQSTSNHNSTQVNIATPPMSPSSSPANSRAGAWSPSVVPSLHLPGVSRLRAALSARDISLEDLEMVPEYDSQLFNDYVSHSPRTLSSPAQLNGNIVDPISDFPCLSPRNISSQARLSATVAGNGCGITPSRAAKYRTLGLNVALAGHEELIAPEVISSPRSMVHESPRMSQLEQQLQFQKAHIQNQIHDSPRMAQLEQQLQFQKPQVNSQVLSSLSDQLQLQLQQSAIESQLQGSPRLHSSHQQIPAFGLGSLSSLGGLTPDRQSSCEVSLSPSVAAARAVFAQHDKRSNSSRDLGSGMSLSDWGSPTGKPEWGMQGEDLSNYRRSASFGVGREDPDVSWVQKLVKDAPQDENGADGVGRDANEHPILGPWVDDVHLDRIVA